jgi:hypothetical protein
VALLGQPRRRGAHAELLGVARTRWSLGNQGYPVFAMNRPQPARHILSAEASSPLSAAPPSNLFCNDPRHRDPVPNRAERRSPLGALM